MRDLDAVNLGQASRMFAVPAYFSAILLGAIAYLALGVALRLMSVPYFTTEWAVVLAIFLLPALICPEDRRKQAITAAIALLLVVVVVSFGLRAVASVLLVFLGSFAIGARLRALVWRKPSTAGASLDLALGLCLTVTIFGLAARFARLDASLVGFLLAVFLWLGRDAVASTFRQTVRTIEDWPATLSKAELIAACFLAGVVAYTALGCFLPTLGFDEHTLHLRLWTDLAYSGKASLDPATHVWALAPFATDLLYALPNLVAGADTRGVMNLALLLLTTKDLYRAALGISAPTTIRLLAVGLFVSTPLLLYATTSLQTELWMIFLATRFAGAILRGRRGPLPLYALEVLSLAALMAAAKLTGTLLGSLMLVAALTRLRDDRDNSVECQYFWALVAFGLVIVTALQSYVTAWILSGNPVFPLFNGIFRSPYFDPINFTDTRWTHHNNISGFIGMFWHTHEYLESRDGVAGFQYLFVLPLAGAALILRQRATLPLLALFIATVLYTIIAYSQLQYVRYLLPIMPVASLLLFAALSLSFAAAPTAARTYYAAAMAFCVLISALNMSLAKGSMGYLETLLGTKMLPSKREAYMAAYVPEWRANKIVNALSGTSARVLYATDRPFGATLAGTPLYPNWYNPTFQRAVFAATSADDFNRLADRFGLTHVLWDAGQIGETSAPEASYRRALAEYLASYGLPIRRVGGVIDVYALNATPYPISTLFDLASPTDFARLVPAPSQQNLEDGLSVNAQDHTFRASIPRGNATVLKIETSFTCERASLFLIHVLWDGGVSKPHYRPVRCEPGKRNDFVDLAQIPPSAKTIVLYFNTHPSNPGPVNIQRFVAKAR